MLKQWIVRRKQSRMSVDPNDPTMHCPVAHPEAEGLMASAEEVCQAWRSHCETDTWRRCQALHALGERHLLPLGSRGRDRAAERRRAVRPPHGHLVALPVLHASRGRGPDAPYSCWCPACFEVAAAGPGASIRLSSDYMVRDGCDQAPQPGTRNPRVTRFTNGKTRAGQDQGAYKQPGQAGAGTGTSSRRWASQPGQWVLV
jgi:hypothetical protein